MSAEDDRIAFKQSEVRRAQEMQGEMAGMVSRAEYDALARALAESEERMRVLERVEWFQQMYNGRAECPWCGGYRDEGHRTGCVRAALLEGEPDAV